MLSLCFQKTTLSYLLLPFSHPLIAFYDCPLTFGLQPFPILKIMTIRDSKKEEKMTGRKQSSKKISQPKASSDTYLSHSMFVENIKGAWWNLQTHFFNQGKQIHWKHFFSLKMFIPVIKYGISGENQKAPPALSQASWRSTWSFAYAMLGWVRSFFCTAFLVVSRFIWFWTGTVLRSWKLLQDMKNVSCPALAWRLLYHQIKWSIMVKLASLVRFIIV